MFDQVAPRYDFLNHLLSFSIDRLWWWRSARRFRGVLARPEARILDVCCGTGDMARALLRRRPADAHPILITDFAHQMLLRGVEKLAPPGVLPVEADALCLPLAAGSMDLVTTAFGFRNLANYRTGLEEFYRVLEPDGELGILEFGEPRGFIGRVFGGLYGFYFHRVLPVVGGWLSGLPGAYAYLPSSVQKFPSPEELLKMMRAVGFDQVSWTPYNFGVAGLYRARKPRIGLPQKSPSTPDGPQ